MKKNKEIVPTILVIIILFICLLIFYIKDYSNSNYISKNNNVLNNVKIVPTLITKLDGNSIFSAPFQLIWNDLKNEVVKSDIVFVNDELNQMVNDLNKETFIENDLKEESYYKKYGFMTPNLKKEIEKGIKTKFNIESNLLDNFRFNNNSQDYFFYAMLLKEFKFNYPFDILSKETFGIDSNSNSQLDSNLKVFYQDSKTYAVKINTTSIDELIFYKGEVLNNFKETYEKINFNEFTEFLQNDILTVSNLDFEIKQGFPEIENKEFLINNSTYFIEKTLQIIEFKLDNSGGSLKSEAGMSVNKVINDDKRHFNFLNNFFIFVKEKNSINPYLAIYIQNIEDFK